VRNLFPYPMGIGFFFNPNKKKFYVHKRPGLFNT
jgi:hypothetical protein